MAYDGRVFLLILAALLPSKYCSALHSTCRMKNTTVCILHELRKMYELQYTDCLVFIFIVFHSSIFRSLQAQRQVLALLEQIC